MNTMKAALWTFLFTSIIILCFGEVDEYRVNLVPSPIATVEEGTTLDLQCSCNGSHNPDFINWYLDNDTYGLVIMASSCKYLIRPKYYEIDRYNISCHETKFNLSIANISKGKDNQDTWKCDTTVIGMQPSHKASTTIMVIEADKADSKGGANNVAGEPVVIFVAVLSGFGLLTIAIVGCLIYQRRKNDETNALGRQSFDRNSSTMYPISFIDGDNDHIEEYSPSAPQKLMNSSNEDYVENTTNQDHEQMNMLVDIGI